MFTPPIIMIDLARERQSEVISTAERHRRTQPELRRRPHDRRTRRRDAGKGVRK
jgi:hypothetical protein